MNLSEYLVGREAYRLGVRARDWQEAVRLCVDILQKNGAAQACYYDAIVEEVEELGPYFLIGPGLAMPHTRPERGALQNGFALITLCEPVDVKGEPADLFLAFSAASAQEQNTEMIMEIAVLLGDEQRVESLRRARDSRELERILAAVDYTE